MNYTIIVHEEARHGYDRCGDGWNEPGTFEVFCTSDQTEFVKKWAEFDLKQPSGCWDDFQILYDGVPTEFDDAHYELERLKDIEYAALKKQAEADKLEAKRRAEEEARVKAARAVEAQRQADLAQLEALKKKLGV